MTYTGKIIVLAFPDTFVKMSDEVMCKILPLLGLGTKTHIKAGHAALILIENQTGKAQYFDFGRYITPKGKGRVRGANTDVELDVPIQAKIINDKLKNLEEFLIWLDAHPEKTHGNGRLVASLCESIDYRSALDYILTLQSKGSIPYKAFGKEGSNCARFVTETILSSTDDRTVIKYLKRNKKFTPSTVGNVEKSASFNGVYQVLNGVVKEYSSSALRENLTNYFDKRIPEKPHLPVNVKSLPKNAQYLDGTGSGAWFHLEPISEHVATIRRFTEKGILDFQGETQLPLEFDVHKDYTFEYDSNCLFCTIKQSQKSFRLEFVSEKGKTSSLVQRERSA